MDLSQVIVRTGAPSVVPNQIIPNDVNQGHFIQIRPYKYLTNYHVTTNKLIASIQITNPSLSIESFRDEVWVKPHPTLDIALIDFVGHRPSNPIATEDLPIRLCNDQPDYAYVCCGEDDWRGIRASFEYSPIRVRIFYNGDGSEITFKFPCRKQYI